MRFKSKEASAPPPPYSPLVSYPEQEPLSDGYPHPAISGTPYYLVAPPTTAIDVSVQSIVYRMEHEEPSCICRFCQELCEAICFRICMALVTVIIIIGIAFMLKYYVYGRS